MHKASPCFINLSLYIKLISYCDVWLKNHRNWCLEVKVNMWWLAARKTEKRRNMLCMMKLPPSSAHTSCPLPFHFPFFPYKSVSPHLSSLRCSFEWNISLLNFSGCQPFNKPGLLSIESPVPSTGFKAVNRWTRSGNNPKEKAWIPLWCFYFWGAQASSYSWVWKS